MIGYVGTPKCGLSMVEMARLMSVTPPTIHNWESGKSRPSGLHRVVFRLHEIHKDDILNILSAVEGVPMAPDTWIDDESLWHDGSGDIMDYGLGRMLGLLFS